MDMTKSKHRLVNHSFLHRDILGISFHAFFLHKHGKVKRRRGISEGGVRKKKMREQRRVRKEEELELKRKEEYERWGGGWLAFSLYHSLYHPVNTYMVTSSLGLCVTQLQA